MRIVVYGGRRGFGIKAIEVESADLVNEKSPCVGIRFPMRQQGLPNPVPKIGI